MQLGIPYEIVGPDGTRAVLNDRTDPDFVGFLTGDDAVTLRRELRTGGQELVEADGGLNGPSYFGRLAMTMQGIIDPQDPQSDSVRERRLRGATRAMRADAKVAWTPVGETRRRLLVRRQNDVDVKGRLPKSFQVSLISAQPFVQADSEQSLTIVPGAAGGEIGYGSPLASPYGSSYQATGATVVSYGGDVSAWPRFRIVGPITNPQILNNTTGRKIGFLYSLADGETLDVFTDPIPRRAVLLGGAADRYGSYDYPNSAWWPLVKGANDIRLLAASYTAGASLTIYWRDTWET